MNWPITSVVIDHGRAIAAGTVGELKASVGRDVIEVAVAAPAEVDAGRADPRAGHDELGPFRRGRAAHHGAGAGRAG